MLNINEIEKQYPESLRTFKRFILREYLQHKILALIYESKYGSKLCFLGGTCLRIIHNNTRFSEDLDFDCLKLSERSFSAISLEIKKGLEREGYGVQFRAVSKGAFHCYIKFPGLLFAEGLSGHKEEKILIQLDAEPQHFKFKPETFILNKFDVFTTVLTTPKPLLLSQKFYAALNRKQAKGRDFFDIMFLLKDTKPDYDYLEQKLGIKTEKELKDKLTARCKKLNMKQVAADVKPFLFESKDAVKVELFEKYINQTKLS